MTGLSERREIVGGVMALFLINVSVLMEGAMSSKQLCTESLSMGIWSQRDVHLLLLPCLLYNKN